MYGIGSTSLRTNSLIPRQQVWLPLHKGILCVPNIPVEQPVTCPPVCGNSGDLHEKGFGEFALCFLSLKGPSCWGSSKVENESCLTSWHKARAAICHLVYIYMGWLWLAKGEMINQMRRRCVCQNPSKKQENNINFWGKSIEKEFSKAKLLWKIK